MSARIAVVTGGNRGIGLEVCRLLGRGGDRVVLCSRVAARGEAAAAELRGEGLDVRAAPVDVTDAAAVSALRDGLLEQHGRVDVLINNAGVLLEGSRGGGYRRVLDADLDISAFDATMAVNVRGALLMARAFMPGMIERGHGRVVNVSSGMGRLCELDAEAPFYRLSKAALNALTRVLADAAAGHDVLVNAVCPGWVRTSMGGPAAVRSAAEGAEGIVAAANLPAGSHRGQLLRDGDLFWEGAARPGAEVRR